MVTDQKVSFMQFMKDNWLITVAVLTLLFTVVIFQLIRRMRAEHLADRQRQMLEKASHAAELQQTISSLLDNMPGICLTKDANTGEYLACNQTFADYVHKKDPSEVIGLKAADVFDEDKVRNFAEDDKMVLAMDEPLIYYDNMPDVFGNTVNVKVIKQKYTDVNGRLCILMIYQDVSDSLRISRGKVNSKESYEKARNDGLIFTHIAQALARGFRNLFYVDINSEEFIEYHSDEKDGNLCEVRRGWHFFEEGDDAAQIDVYPEDREEVMRAMDRKTLVSALDKNNMFMMTYRMMTDGQPRYVNMKVARIRDDERFIVISMTDIDEQMKHRQAAQRMLEEQIAYSRVSALAGEFLCIYIVEPETGKYRKYSSSAEFDVFDMPAEGEDFLSDLRENSIRVVYPDDKNRVFTALTMDNAMAEVIKNGIFTISYRLMMNDEPRYVQLKAALDEEQDGRRLVVGVNDIDAQVRQEEEYSRRLAQARIEANIDALTGVKNRNAYRVYEERLNAQIEMNRAPDFAITILDLNDLKKINDTQGHKAGDQYLRDACRLICTTFKRSPVFRVGGDEFAVLSQGDDYERIEELLKILNDHNDEAILTGGIVVALGMARYDHNEKVAQVYELADQRMYENKSYLKEKKKQRG
jgi:diguanylate cyclase (GGDEF)-like protein